MRGRAAFVYSAWTVDDVTQSDAYRPSVDGTLLSVLMDQIFFNNHSFYTLPALAATINFNSLEAYNERWRCCR